MMFNIEHTFALNHDIIRTICETDNTLDQTANHYKVDRQLVKALNYGDGAFNYSVLGIKYPVHRWKLHNILTLQSLCEERNIDFYVTSTTIKRLSSF